MTLPVLDFAALRVEIEKRLDGLHPELELYVKNINFDKVDNDRIYFDLRARPVGTPENTAEATFIRGQRAEDFIAKNGKPITWKAGSSYHPLRQRNNHKSTRPKEGDRPWTRRT